LLRQWAKLRQWANWTAQSYWHCSKKRAGDLSAARIWDREPFADRFSKVFRMIAADGGDFRRRSRANTLMGG
jgi:hypothetical protein